MNKWVGEENGKRMFWVEKIKKLISEKGGRERLLDA